MQKIPMEMMRIYQRLLDSYGPQGWWPCSGCFSPPELEICIGAILTQNTSWANVEKALEGMRRQCLTTAGAIQKAEIRQLESAIRPSGFYAQKAERLKAFSDFVAGYGGFRAFQKQATRSRLLGVIGIGPETADSMLLYALGRPEFVIDAYTIRVFTRLGAGSGTGCAKDCSIGTGIGRSIGSKKMMIYGEWKRFFESNVRKDANVYREFHALIVELAKRHCRAKPVCNGCPLGKVCRSHV